MIDYVAILTRKYPDSVWIFNGDDYSGLSWKSETTKPTKKELDALWAEVQAEIEAEIKAKADAKAALLERLNITQEEAKILLS